MADPPCQVMSPVRRTATRVERLFPRRHAGCAVQICQLKDFQLKNMSTSRSRTRLELENGRGEGGSEPHKACQLAAEGFGWRDCSDSSYARYQLVLRGVRQSSQQDSQISQQDSQISQQDSQVSQHGSQRGVRARRGGLWMARSLPRPSPPISAGPAGRGRQRESRQDVE